MIGQLLWNSIVAIIYGSSTHCIFLDLARAFNSVSHPRTTLEKCLVYLAMYLHVHCKPT